MGKVSEKEYVTESLVCIPETKNTFHELSSNIKLG